MESTRSIKKILKAQKVNMGGVILDQALPLREVDQIDPILLIHHWKDDLKGGKHQSKVGVGPHPHRGFAPVTFIFQGSVHHRDSIGGNSVVHAGGTQWMDSGKGIVHSERPSSELAENGGIFEIIQFWVNVPSSKKMLPADYKPLQKEDTPMVLSDDKKVSTSVVSGDFKGVNGPIPGLHDYFLTRHEFEKDGFEEIIIPKNYNALVYVLNGELTLNDEEVISTKNMVWFNNDGEGITLKANENSRAIILSGKPIEEPVVSYGPFVMNTEQEIMQAMEDYQTGKMGVLNEQFN